MNKGNEVLAEIEQAEAVTFGKKDFTAYNRLMANIEKGFVKASDAYVTISCALWEIYHNEYYRIDGYKTIVDFAQDKYDFRKSTTHNYIKVMEKFGEIVDGKAKGLKEQFKPFKCSQLIYMLTFTPEQLESVKPEWSVRDIIEFGKMPLQVEEQNIDDSEADEDTSDGDSSGSEDFAGEFLTPPEIETGRTFLAEFKDLSEMDKIQDSILSAYENMRNDPNFKNKNVRFVLELAFD